MDIVYFHNLHDMIFMCFFITYSIIASEGEECFSWEVFLIAFACAVVVFIPLTIVYLAKREKGG